MRTKATSCACVLETRYRPCTFRAFCRRGFPSSGCSTTVRGTYPCRAITSWRQARREALINAPSATSSQLPEACLGQWTRRQFRKPRVASELLFHEYKVAKGLVGDPCVNACARTVLQPRGLADGATGFARTSKAGAPAAASCSLPGSRPWVVTRDMKRKTHGVLVRPYLYTRKRGAKLWEGGGYKKA